MTQESFQNLLYKKLRDKDYARIFLKEALEESYESGNFEDFLIALKAIIIARNGMTSLAKKTNLSRQSLYKALSGQGNPTLSTLDAILKNLGFRIYVDKRKK